LKTYESGGNVHRSHVKTIITTATATIIIIAANNQT